MKTLLIIIAFVHVLPSSFAQTKYEVLRNGKLEKLLGHVETTDFEKEPFESWYQRYYSEYIVDTVALDKLVFDFDSVQVFFGTWCKDSKEHLPAFIKVLERLQQKEKLRLVGVENISFMYKQSPDGQHFGKNIHRIPTFIFYEASEEIGRIIETPGKSLENDMYALSQGTYTPNYQIIESIDSIFISVHPDNWEDNLQSILNTFGMPETADDFHTWARVLKQNGRIAACKLILETNYALFPSTWFTSFYLGLLHEEMGNVPEAIKYYQKTYEIQPQGDFLWSKVEALKRLSDDR